jgi:hypothetical protein
MGSPGENKKLARDFSGSSKKQKDHQLNLHPDQEGQGINHDDLVEPTPNYINAPCEKVIQGKNNQRIVLGRDRPGQLGSGYGGSGHTQAGSIDLIVGPQSSDIKEKNKLGENVYVDPDFDKDAARIYISQKSDIDQYFGLVGSSGAEDSKMRASIAMKADTLRLIGRENIRLVTGTSAKNSQNGRIDAPGGIDLIAGNDDTDVQPLVKGDRLVDVLDKIVDNLVTLNGIVYDFIRRQSDFNQTTAMHTHLDPIGPHPVPPSPDLPPALMVFSAATIMSPIQSIVTQRKNLMGVKANYLLESGPKYINSRFNHTN